MRTKLLLVLSLSLLTFLSNAQLQKHIEAGNKAYLKYANKEAHAKYRSTKNITSYNVGDTKTFWSWSFAAMPPSWVQKTATCRAVGEKSYVFVADEDWGSNMNQDDVDSVLAYLEDKTLVDSTMGIVEMDETYFGEIPDELDADPKVIFYFSSLGSYNGSVFDGYFSAFNQLTESEAQQDNNHSNECEMLYMSCDPIDPSSMSTLTVLAHELQHLIHHGYDTDEETWLNEGCSEFAMVLFGQPDPITSFNTSSNNGLLSWDQTFSDYVQTMLFFTYLSEQTTGPTFIKALVANTQNGYESINQELANISYPLNFQEFTSQWLLANYISDTTVNNGIYGYNALSLPGFTSEYIYSYPETKSSHLFGCAANYYRLNTTFENLNIDFEGTSMGTWEFNLISYEDDIVMEIIPFNGTAIDFAQPTGYSLTKLVLVVTNAVTSTIEKNYTFTVENNPTSIKSIEQSSFGVYPNPVNENSIITCNINTESDIDIDIYTIDGKHINNVFSGKKSKGEYTFNLNKYNLSKGMYIVNFTVNQKLIKQNKIIIK